MIQQPGPGEAVISVGGRSSVLDMHAQLQRIFGGMLARGRLVSGSRSGEIDWELDGFAEIPKEHPLIVKACERMLLAASQAEAIVRELNDRLRRPLDRASSQVRLPTDLVRRLGGLLDSESRADNVSVPVSEVRLLRDALERVARGVRRAVERGEHRARGDQVRFYGWAFLPAASALPQATPAGAVTLEFRFEDDQAGATEVLAWSTSGGAKFVELIRVDGEDSLVSEIRAEVQRDPAEGMWRFQSGTLVAGVQYIAKAEGSWGTVYSNRVTIPPAERPEAASRGVDTPPPAAFPSEPSDWSAGSLEAGRVEIEGPVTTVVEETLTIESAGDPERRRRLRQRVTRAVTAALLLLLLMLLAASAWLVLPYPRVRGDWNVPLVAEHLPRAGGAVDRPLVVDGLEPVDGIELPGDPSKPVRRVGERAIDGRQFLVRGEEVFLAEPDGSKPLYVGLVETFRPSGELVAPRSRPGVPEEPILVPPPSRRLQDVVVVSGGLVPTGGEMTVNLDDGSSRVGIPRGRSLRDVVAVDRRPVAPGDPRSVNTAPTAREEDSLDQASPQASTSSPSGVGSDPQSSSSTARSSDAVRQATSPAPTAGVGATLSWMDGGAWQLGEEADRQGWYGVVGWVVDRACFPDAPVDGSALAEWIEERGAAWSRLVGETDGRVIDVAWIAVDSGSLRSGRRQLGLSVSPRRWVIGAALKSGASPGRPADAELKITGELCQSQALARRLTRWLTPEGGVFDLVDFECNGPGTSTISIEMSQRSWPSRPITLTLRSSEPSPPPAPQDPGEPSTSPPAPQDPGEPSPPPAPQDPGEPSTSPPAPQDPGEPSTSPPPPPPPGPVEASPLPSEESSRGGGDEP